MLRPTKRIQAEVLPAIAVKDCLAKTRRLPSGKIASGRIVKDHCFIVGEIARRIVRHYPQAEKLFNGDVGLIASMHDIGKITPAFQKKLRKVIEDEKEVSTVEAAYQYHGGASYIVLKELGFPDSLAWSLGSHHGILKRNALQKFSATSEILGGASWQSNRQEFYQDAKTYFKVGNPASKGEWNDRLIGGITQQADWIGSGLLFDNPEEEWTELIDRAVEEAGYSDIDIKKDLSFKDIFHFEARTVQKNLIDAVEGPGVYILEAPMGIGKTEAALYAAYKMLEKGKARGIYFALPTCLTSLKIKDRVDQFLSRILNSDGHCSQLLVGKSSSIASDSGEMGPGSAWFSQYHRRVLDKFGVGTIDQALFAAMLNKRSFVTLSGLAGKVVILDEVHSYDCYTRLFLEILVEKLKSLQCTVLILSATLSSSSRSKLLFGVDSKTETSLNLGYPLISKYPADRCLEELIQPVENSRTVHIELKSNGNAVAIDQAIARALDGQQVLWIENSVGDAQEIYSILSSRLYGLDIELGLLHSKFLPSHRAEVEDHWVNLYGKNSKERSIKGRILIGTQVLEQSLDIDADFLITRLAPIDLLLQRLGRLWRHQQTKRPASAKNEAWILTPGELEQALISMPKEFKATSVVYYPYVLLRTLEVLEKMPGQINLPEDMRTMIEDVYSDREESGEFIRHLNTMVQGTKNRPGTKKKVDLASLAAVTENCTETRLSEPMIDVLLIHGITKDTNNSQTVIETLSGKTIKLPWSISDRVLRKSLADQIDRELLRIRRASSVHPSNRSFLKNEYHLDKYVYLGDDMDDEFIWVGVVGSDGDICTVGSSELKSGYRYRYSKDLGCVGLEKIKKE